MTEKQIVRKHYLQFRIKALIDVLFFICCFALPLYSQTTEELRSILTDAEKLIGKPLPTCSLPTTSIDVYEYPEMSEIIQKVVFDEEIAYQYNYIEDTDTGLVITVMYCVYGSAAKINDAWTTARKSIAGLLNDSKNIFCRIEDGWIEGNWKNGLYCIRTSEQVYSNDILYYFYIVVDQYR